MPAHHAHDRVIVHPARQLHLHQRGARLPSWARCTFGNRSGGGCGGRLAVAVGAYHTLLVTADGELFSFGLNSHGQLARPTSELMHAQPVRARLPAAVAGLRVEAASGGMYHTVLLLQGGAVCSFGDNAFGQLGSAAPHRVGACANLSAAVGEAVVQARARDDRQPTARPTSSPGPPRQPAFV